MACNLLHAIVALTLRHRRNGCLVVLVSQYALLWVQLLYADLLQFVISVDRMLSLCDKMQYLDGRCVVGAQVGCAGRRCAQGIRSWRSLLCR
jgi:hypothetical protein